MNKPLPDFQISWSGPIVIIGFGSIGTAVLPLVRRHFRSLQFPVTVIDPRADNKPVADRYGARFLQVALTQDNHRDVLTGVLQGQPPGFIINVSTDVSTEALVAFAQSAGAMYIDTCTEPWPGYYFNDSLTLGEKSNYALRESLLAMKPQCEGGPTAISCCGANPGMVSWLVKQALLDIARDTGGAVTPPTGREGWARLMMQLGVKGIHIAERDTQQAIAPRRPGTFLNTWSVQGLLAEAVQPAELGWGTHEAALPPDGREHASGSRAAIYLEAPSGTQRVRTWTPTHGHHCGYIISHNEAISIADYFSLYEDGRLTWRPTCLYAYRPTDMTVDSLKEFFDRGCRWPEETRVLAEHEIAGGSDELGVLLYGHARNAYWYGSQLSIEKARRLAPHQNATSLQVSSAVMAALAWAVEHPRAGLVEAEELDFAQCLQYQAPYLGTLGGHYTDWKPETDASGDPWQFHRLRYAGQPQP